MTDAKKENRIIFICWLAYAAAYVGRLNYSASIVAIVASMGVAKSQAGLVSSCFFFAYGAGQLVNGILSKKYNSRIMVFFSLVSSSALNLAMPLCGSISLMKYIWLANGAVQSILWSTLIKTISEHVSDGKISKAIVVMSTPVAAGTLGAYGLSAFFVKFFTWRYTFFAASAVLISAAFIWFFSYGNEMPKVLEVKAKEKSEKTRVPVPLIFFLASVCLAGIANGFVKDGINTWVPSVLYESFGISQSFSILLTLLLPIVSLCGATVVAAVHKKIRSVSVMNMIFYIIGVAVCSGILFTLKIRSLAFLMILFTLTACLMSMINNVITSIFPLDMRRVLGSGFLAGLVNSFCYVGSTVTSYTLGSVAQKQGWNMVFVIMLCVCAAAAVASLAGIALERKNKAVGISAE
ncbi:MAG: MFS transporter [Clostridia bacterium]|nr:MFS transporter [Clostridia bacterium]